MQRQTANVILFGYEICSGTEMTISSEEAGEMCREVAQTERNLSD